MRSERLTPCEQRSCTTTSHVKPLCTLTICTYAVHAYHKEREDSQAPAPNCSEVYSVGGTVVANQLHTSIDVTVQPIDLHTGIWSHQQANKCGSEDPITIEVPVKTFALTSDISDDNKQHS